MILLIRNSHSPDLCFVSFVNFKPNSSVCKVPHAARKQQFSIRRLGFDGGVFVSVFLMIFFYTSSDQWYLKLRVVTPIKHAHAEFGFVDWTSASFRWQIDCRPVNLSTTGPVTFFKNEVCTYSFFLFIRRCCRIVKRVNMTLLNVRVYHLSARSNHLWFRTFWFNLLSTNWLLFNIAMNSFLCT